MEQSISTRKDVSNIPMVKKKPKVNDDTLQPVGALVRQINHNNPNWKNPVSSSLIVSIFFMEWWIEGHCIDSNLHSV